MTDRPYDHPNCTFARPGGVLTCTECGAHADGRNVMAYPTPIACRLDLWTPTGWVTQQEYVMLLHPERYPERLEERRKYGRAVEVETGTVHAPRRLPKRTELVPTDSNAWGLPDPNRRGMCRHCDGYHGDPFDGSCLI